MLAFQQAAIRVFLCLAVLRIMCWAAIGIAEALHDPGHTMCSGQHATRTSKLGAAQPLVLHNWNVQHVPRYTQSLQQHPSCNTNTNTKPPTRLTLLRGRVRNDPTEACQTLHPNATYTCAPQPPAPATRPPGSTPPPGVFRRMHHFRAPPLRHPATGQPHRRLPPPLPRPTPPTVAPPPAAAAAHPPQAALPGPPPAS